MDAKTFIPLLLLVGAMWFMSNRNKKQQRKAGDFRANLEVGQDVMTGSGLYGTIVGIEDDVITLESTPGNASRWIRAAISKVIEPPVLESDAEDTDDVEDFTDEADDDFESESSERTLDVPDDLSSLTETPRKDDDTTDKK